MILDRSEGNVQEIEYKSDTGYLHVGISICSQKREFVREQRDLLSDEPEKHNDRRKYRHNRRNRKRYRAARFDNRVRKVHKAEKMGHVWLPPSLDHKVDVQVQLFLRFFQAMPIKRAIFEMGQFDLALIKALEKGEAAPEGVEYQMGERYQIATRRAAVFVRDHYRCVFCNRSIQDHAILHVHHIGFWKKDRSNRLDNLATCCEQCHTPENHKPGGKLYGAKPEVKSLASATFMNTVRFELLRRLKEKVPSVEFHISYGTKTSVVRKQHSLLKSHTNDAYCLGMFFPKLRTEEQHYQKIRRNNRILQKFYDAVYIDARDDSLKKGQELTNGRINRNHKKDHENLHPFRQKKIGKGRVTIRRRRTELKPGSLVEYKDEILVVHGTHQSHYKTKDGTIKFIVNIEFEHPAHDGRKSAAKNKCKIISKNYNTGWKKVEEAV